MKVTVTDLGPTQKKLLVVVEPRDVKRLLDKRYRELSQQVRLKGFRPGKVPRKILESYYGKTVQGEVSNHIIRDTYPDALKQTELKPMLEGDVEDYRFEPDGSFSYSAIVEVRPVFEVKDYLGLEVEVPPTEEIGDERVDEELKALQERHAEVRSVQDDRPAQWGDYVIVDLVPSVDGAVFDKGVQKNFYLELGTHRIHPDFDGHLVGRRAGETVDCSLNFPDDAAVRDFAGKTVHFEVAINEIKEKILPELNEAFAQKVGGYASVEALKDALKERLSRAAEQATKQRLRAAIMDQLLNMTSFEVPEKVVEREVNRRIQHFVHQMTAQGLKIDPSRFDTPEIRAEQRPEAEKAIRWRLIVEQVAAQENLELSEDEKEAIYSDVARMYRTTPQQVKAEYADSAIVMEMVYQRLEEKVFKLLEDHAVAKATTAETAS
ncbi:trigger factor [Desulfosoma caldarium]|nr:trigger factor [Desulfosoma caldarium]